MASRTSEWYPGHYYAETLLLKQNTQTRYITLERHILKQDLPENRDVTRVEPSQTNSIKLSDKLPDNSFQIIHLVGPRREPADVDQNSVARKERLEDCHFLDLVSQMSKFPLEHVRAILENINVSFIQYLVGDEDETQREHTAFQLRGRHNYAYWRYDGKRRTTRLVLVRLVPPTLHDIERFGRALEEKTQLLRQCFGHPMLPALLLTYLVRQSMMARLLNYAHDLHIIEHRIQLGSVNRVSIMHSLRDLGRSSIRHMRALSGYKRIFERCREFDESHYSHKADGDANDRCTRDNIKWHLNNLTSIVESDSDQLDYICQSVEHQLLAIGAIVNMTDSTSMKTIAVLTLVFLPSTCVATIFSMPMFPLSAADLFWSYWAVSIPLSLIVLMSWLSWWYLRAARQYYDASSQDARKTFLGWRTGPGERKPGVEPGSTHHLRQRPSNGVDNSWMKDRDWETEEHMV